MNELSFFITTSVTNEIHNFCLNACIAHIRANYKEEEIIIISDNSTPDLMKIDKQYLNLRIIESEFKGAGESLFPYYYHKLKPSRKAIYIHDSMFLLEPIDLTFIKNFKTMKFFLSFPHKFRMREQDDFIRKLRNGNEIIAHTNTNNWVGCFGGACIIALDYLNYLQEKYDITCLVNYINCRVNREVYERILGAILSYEEQTKDNLSLLGDMYDYFGRYPTNDFHNIYVYVNHFNIIKEQKIPLLKLNFGR